MSKNVDTICVQGGYQPGKRRIPHTPNHSGDNLQIQVKRTDEPTVRPIRIRILLHPTAEPNQRHHRSENLRNGRRRGRNADLIRPGGELLRTLQHLQQR